MGRRDDPTTVVMPSWTSPSSSLGLLPGAGTILCCVPQPALPWRSCPSALALTSMPALLWMLSTSPASSRAKDPKASQEQPHHCPMEETLPTVSCTTQGIHFPLILACKTVRLRRGRASQQEPGQLDLQLCQGSPAPVLTLCTVRFCSWSAAVLCRLAHKLISYTMVLSNVLAKPRFCFFYGLNTGLLTAPGAGPGQRCGCRVSGSEKQLSQTPARAQSCLPTRDHAQHSASTQKSLADVAQHRQVPAAKVLAGFDVPLCLNLIRNPWLTVGLGGS